MTRSTLSKVTQIIRLILSILIFLALFFVPAGTWKWTEAWILIAFYLLTVAGAILWLRKNDPDLLRERAKRNKYAKAWDRNIMLLYIFFLMVLLIVAGLDAVRFGWSQVPLVLKVIAFLGFIPGFILGFWAMRENSFLSDAVRIQEERGHTICRTGPYRFIRHPMYSGIILSMLCLPIALGSYYALFPAVVIVFLFIVRTALEDKTLQKELEGYTEYTKNVRFRLIPRVW